MGGGRGLRPDGELEGVPDDVSTLQHGHRRCNLSDGARETPKGPCCCRACLHSASVRRQAYEHLLWPTMFIQHLLLRTEIRSC